MKKLLLLLVCFSCASLVQAQLIKKLGDRAKNKLEQKAGEKVDKSIDDAVDGKSGTKSKSESKSEVETDDGEVKVKKEDGETKVKTESKNPDGLKAYSKYDFIPGEKVLAFENFERTDIGDFPTKWNTNATAEVVTINNKEGKWLKISKEGAFHPEFITSLPDNFTLEFDLAVNDNWRGTHMSVNIANLKSPEDFVNYYHYISWRENYAVQVQLRPSQSGNTKARSKITAGVSGNHPIHNDVDFTGWNNAGNNFVHISMWRQGQRLRVYANSEKIWDLPRAFDATSKFNAVTFGVQGSYGEDDYMLLGNIRLAVGAPDTRNKLITEGKFVTTGILFDVNSDKIKPESYGTLKDIAAVLKDNEQVRVKIIGHTDNDGDDAKNLELSKKRAASVRIVLTTEFGIDGTRFETDGMGESKPAAPNTTPEGKAQNRRVEFIKL